MSIANVGGIRKKGSGSIRRSRWGIGYEVRAPMVNGRNGEWLGRVDTYREGERLIEKYIAANDNDTAKAG